MFNEHCKQAIRRIEKYESKFNSDFATTLSDIYVDVLKKV